MHVLMNTYHCTDSLNSQCHARKHVANTTQKILLYYKISNFNINAANKATLFIVTYNTYFIRTKLY